MSSWVLLGTIVSTHRLGYELLTVLSAKSSAGASRPGDVQLVREHSAVVRSATALRSRPCAVAQFYFRKVSLVWCQGSFDCEGLFVGLRMFEGFSVARHLQDAFAG